MGDCDLELENPGSPDARFEITDSKQNDNNTKEKKSLAKLGLLEKNDKKFKSAEPSDGRFFIVAPKQWEEEIVKRNKRWESRNCSSELLFKFIFEPKKCTGDSAIVEVSLRDQTQ